MAVAPGIIINLPPLPINRLDSVPSIAALRAIPSAQLENGHDVLADGRDAVGDGYGGIYTWSELSTLDDNGSSVIRPNDVPPLAAGRWILTGAAQAGGNFPISTPRFLEVETEGQVTFLLDFSPSVDPIVYYNGARVSRLVGERDFSISGNQITFNMPTSLDDIIELIPNEVLLEQPFSHAVNYPAGSQGEKLAQNNNPLDAPYSAVGDGTSNDRLALIGADARGPVTITENHYVATNMSFSNMVTFVGNGGITRAAGATVTFEDGISAVPGKRIFFGAGDVAGLKDVHAEWFTDANGTSDDTTGLNKAVACVGAGGIVRMGFGNWKITDEIVVANDRVKFIDAGRKASSITQYTVTKNIFKVTGDYFEAHNMSVDFASQGGGTAGAKAFSFDGCFYSILVGIYSYRARVGVEYINASNSHFATQMFIEDATENGVIVLNSANVCWTQSQILNSNTASLCTLGCVRLYGATEGCNFTDVQTYQGVRGLTTGADAYTFGQRPSYNKFMGCYFDGCIENILDKAVETDFINTWFSASPVGANDGLYVGQCDGVRFNGGQSVNSRKHGVRVTAMAKRVSFSLFAARSNSTSVANTFSGIFFEADTTDFKVLGCDFTNAGLNFGTQKYGVEVATGASDRYVIRDNLIGGNGTAGISDGGTGVNKSVGDNF